MKSDLDLYDDLGKQLAARVHDIHHSKLYIKQDASFIRVIISGQPVVWLEIELQSSGLAFSYLSTYGEDLERSDGPIGTLKYNNENDGFMLRYEFEKTEKLLSIAETVETLMRPLMKYLPNP